MKTTQKELPKSQMEIEFELTEEEFKHFFEHALERLKQHVKIDGFREGKAPVKMVEDKIKPESLLMEAGDIAVRETYSKYIKGNNLEPIGQPEVKILKIAKGSPFIFTATITILPEVELPNYKEIALKIKSKEVSVDQKEVEDALNYLQKTRAKFTLKNDAADKRDFVEIIYQSKDLENGKEAQDKFILGEGGMIKDFEDNLVGMKPGEEKEFSVRFPENATRKDLAGKDIIFKVKMVSVQKMELPEINDEFAKQIGAFDTLLALKSSIKEGMRAEKTESEKQRKRAEILEKIGEKMKVDLPDVLVEYEKKNAFEDLKQRITQNLKITFEQYLSSIKQTEDGLAETFQKEAEKKIKIFLVLKEIGKKEGIEVLDKEVEEEVSKSIKNYSKDDLQKIDIGQLKEYTKGVIFNEKIFQMLEKFFH